MPIANNLELYQAVKATAADLAVIGLRDDAERLLSALSISSLSGEVLGEIRLVLQSIEQDRLPRKLQSAILDEIAYITSALER